ncbi:MAG: ribosome maturation factor RimM, partial [Pseudomonadota bacterium]
VKSWTQVPEDLAAYGPLWDKGRHRQFNLTLVGTAKNLLLAKVDGVTNRDQAEMLKGLELYVERDALPEPEEEEFYYSDLIGLQVLDGEGQSLGVVRSVQNHGAGDFLEVVSEASGDLLLPFTKMVVPEVDIAAGQIRAYPPEMAEGKVDQDAGEALGESDCGGHRGKEKGAPG